MLVRVLKTFVTLPQISGQLIAMLVVLAVLTLIYGNLAAMPQNNLKRLLAYSSIAHAGYLLIAVASGGAAHSTITIVFYLTGYLLMTLLSFMVIIVVANNSGGDEISHFNGLGKRSPRLAFAMLAAMLSLAGVPFTVGFFGKFLVFSAAYDQKQFLLVGIGIVTVAAGFYYYLKVVRAMYWNEPAEDAQPIFVAPVTKATMIVTDRVDLCPGRISAADCSLLKGQPSGASRLKAAEAAGL